MKTSKSGVEHQAQSDFHHSRKLHPEWWLIACTGLAPSHHLQHSHSAFYQVRLSFYAQLR